MRLALLCAVLGLAAASPVASPDPDAFIPAVASELEARAATYLVTARTGLKCRKGPGTGHATVKTHAYGSRVPIKCQFYGDNVNGNRVWDFTGECWVADYYVKTGRSDMWAGCS